MSKDPAPVILNPEDRLPNERGWLEQPKRRFPWGWLGCLLGAVLITWILL